MALLEVDDIHVAYGSIVALRGVSIQVNAGERVALLGANGAGKTTTLRALSGLMGLKQGSIQFDGKPIGGLPAFKVVGEGVSHVPEGRELFPTLTVEENLRYGFWPRHKEQHRYGGQLDRVFTYFPRLKERRGQAANTLSGGEQQMLVIARGLMSSPRLLMVDELSLGLAPIIVAQLFDIIEQVNQEGTAVIIVEQFVDMALAHTDRAYVLAKGQVILEGPSKDLAQSPEVVASYLGGAAPAEPTTNGNGTAHALNTN
jgi:branched-chain amino acid transport system ATP-binding protein